jgi:septal ring factor EnvC (AmiA/AmiB activator)
MKHLRYSILAVGLLLLPGCDRSEWNLPRTKQAEPAAAATAEQDNAQKNAFLQASRDELNRLRQDLEALKEKIQSATTATRERMEVDLRSFQEQQQHLEAMWEKFQDRGNTTWRADA